MSVSISDIHDNNFLTIPNKLCSNKEPGNVIFDSDCPVNLCIRKMGGYLTVYFKII